MSIYMAIIDGGIIDLVTILMGRGLNERQPILYSCCAVDIVSSKQCTSIGAQA